MSPILNVLLEMFALIGLGLIWAWRNPTGIDTVTTRAVLSGLVYHLLLPALVLNVLWHAPLGANTARIAASAATGVLTSMVLAWLACRLCRSDRHITGAMILASAFPNATYMGLPLLTHTLGPWAGAIAIQYDLFACTPLLLTVGIALAARFGTGPRQNPVLTLLKVPPLWAAGLAVFLNADHVAAPGWLDGLLGMLGAAVVPLMLLVAGMALRGGLRHWRTLPAAIPVTAIQLLWMPAAAWGVASVTGLSGDLRTGVVLEGAMPSMALGVVLCDRYGLNTAVYASALALTTILSGVTLPLWFAALH